MPTISKSSSPFPQNLQWITTLNLDFVVHNPATLMKRSRKERKAKQQGTEVSQIWQTACFVRQMHKSRMPTAFMQFNYVYISLRRVKTCTVRFLPYANRMIPASDSSWLFCFSVVTQNNFLFLSLSSFSSCFVSLALFLSLSTCKSSRFTQTPAGAVICLSNVFCCERKKKKENTEQTSTVQSLAEGREDYYCCLP